VPLYVHPSHPLPQVQQAYYSGFSPEVTAQFSLAGWGWHHEAGIHVLRLILSGTFTKFPGLQVISGHWGIFNLPHFEFIHTVIGADRIIWSVDYPYLTLDGTQEFIGKLTASHPGSGRARQRTGGPGSRRTCPVAIR
jgi:uncharacterized protein